jgi:hypothetical protein
MSLPLLYLAALLLGFAEVLFDNTSQVLLPALVRKDQLQRLARHELVIMTTGLNIATRLLGLLLAAIAIETMADGLKLLFPGLTST